MSRRKAVRPVDQAATRSRSDRFQALSRMPAAQGRPSRSPEIRPPTDLSETATQGTRSRNSSRCWRSPGRRDCDGTSLPSQVIGRELSQLPDPERRERRDRVALGGGYRKHVSMPRIMFPCELTRSASCPVACPISDPGAVSIAMPSRQGFDLPEAHVRQSGALRLLWVRCSQNLPLESRLSRQPALARTAHARASSRRSSPQKTSP